MAQHELQLGCGQQPVRRGHHTYLASNPATHYRASIQVSEVGRHRYIDKSWRLRTAPTAPTQ